MYCLTIVCDVVLFLITFCMCFIWFYVFVVFVSYDIVCMFLICCMTLCFSFFHTILNVFCHIFVWLCLHLLKLLSMSLCEFSYVLYGFKYDCVCVCRVFLMTVYVFPHYVLWILWNLLLFLNCLLWFWICVVVIS